jgi:serine/threonine-protein kinase
VTDDEPADASAGARPVVGEQAGLGRVVASRYRLDARIGAGGMGSVWRARDLQLGRDVALKLVALSDKLARQRFVREGKVAARLDHPGLCRVYDVGAHEGVGHLVMELLAGETVHQRVQRRNLELSWRLAVIGEVARAMATAHQHGLVHRDLKPDNLFLDHLTGRERTVVIDFGLAFLDGADRGELGRLTHANVTGGTPWYMAPEQARAHAIGPPADVYALGCVLHELVAGRPPFEGEASAVMSNQVFAVPAPLVELVPGLAPAVSDLVGAMLAKAPGERPTMAAVADCLDLLASARSAPGRSSPSLRVNRAVTRKLDAVGATPVVPAIGAIAVMGPIADDILVAAACAGLSARRAGSVDEVLAMLRAQPRTVILAEVEDDTMTHLCKLGSPVIGVAPVGDLQLATHLARLGCADVLTRPFQAAVATRKLVRALRRLPAGAPVS